VPGAPSPLDGLPPEDRERSPYTGWTRAHWEHVADALLAGVRPHATPRHALIHLPGGRPSVNGRRSDGLEGFARTFLLAALRLAGAGGEAPGSLAERYAAGLSAGPERGGPESWPRIGHRSQAMVEAALIAVALAESRPWVWDALDDPARQRLAAWLGGIRGKQPRPNNWLLFPVLVNGFLRSVGAPHSVRAIDENLDRVDALHRGSGWYADGRRGPFDHYAGWGFTVDTLLWCRLDGDRRDAARADVYRERARAFLDDYRLLFAANGAPLHYGRSLLYRFAAAAPFWAGELAGASPLAPGGTRRLASGALRYFLDRGATRDGVLTMGWHGEFLPATQPYSGPASPYWAAKAFLGLLLPPEAPAWLEVEEPLPVEVDDFTRTLRAPGLVVWGTTADGIVRASTRGRGRDPHYRKVAYSTHTAPETAGAAARADLDAKSLRAGLNRRLRTSSLLRAPAEVRVHRLVGPGGRTIRAGGFAVADDEPPAAEIGPRWALVRRRDGLTSFVAALSGFDRAGVERNEHGNAFGRHSAVPYLEGRAASDGTAIALVLLTAADVDPEAFL
jgi:hypothetical protein